MPTKKKPPVVLSIAGYDPSSGAGIAADIKTMAAHGCYGVTCITALTVQSTRGVKRVEPMQGSVIAETLELLADDVKIAAVKIGMLGSADAAKAVAVFLKRHSPKFVVLDPVIRSSSGADLISKEGLKILQEQILSRTYVITPNIDEASALTSHKVRNLDDMQLAAARLHEMGVRNVIITGGHLNPPHDLLSQEGKQVLILKGRKVSTRSTHGTGCAFSTSLACHLAMGKDLSTAAIAAKRFVATALSKAPAVGKGTGPII